MKTSDTIDELAKALIDAQSELPQLERVKKGVFDSKYAPIEEVAEKSIAVLKKHGLGISQLVGGGQGQTRLETVLLHRSGQWISESSELFVTKKDPQGQGSAITYMRRYAWMAIIGMVAKDEDDDGNSNRIIDMGKRRVLYALARKHQSVQDESQFDLLIYSLTNKSSTELLESEFEDVQEQIKSGEIRVEE